MDKGNHPRASPSRTRYAALAAIALLAMYFCLAVFSKTKTGATFDEPLHMAGGLSYWQHNDYRLQPENGNLPQRLAALPAYLLGAEKISTSDDAWVKSDGWAISTRMVAAEGGKPFRRNLMSGRMVIALLGGATGLLVFMWTRRLAGDIPGIAALTLFCFSPIFLAHGALVTSDACMALLMLTSVGAWWRHLRNGGVLWWSLSSISFGLACISKFSCVILLPVFAVIALNHLLVDNRGWGRGVLRVAASACVHSAVALLVIWGAYGFRYSAANPNLPAMEQFPLRWEEEVIPDLSKTQVAVTGILRCSRILPESYVYGFSATLKGASHRGAFLDGATSDKGFRSFFLKAFYYKSTTGFLLVICLIGYVTTRLNREQRGRAMRSSLLPLLALALIYGWFALSSNLNIGVRHLLPLYPALFIFAGAALGVALRRMRKVAILMAACVGLHASESLWAYPDYIAFFNTSSGGVSRGYLHLVDSSSDWGQGLPGLADWLAEHRLKGEPLVLSYFGQDNVLNYELDAKRIAPLKVGWPSLTPGLYAIGATNFQQPYLSGRGPWSEAREAEYQRMRLYESNIEATLSSPENYAVAMSSPAAADWLKGIRLYDELRFARLCHFLRTQPPLAVIKGSILVFRLTEADLKKAFDLPPDPKWSRG